MPTSHFYQLNELIEAIVFCRPRSILDIGVGHGKFAVLAREYLDAGCKSPVAKSELRIDGIEGFAAYIGDLHRAAYDEVLIGEASTLIPQLRKRYDLALIIDVIEHFDLERGRRLLADTLRCANNVLVATPRFFSAQDAVGGNQLEIHRSLWTRRDFASFNSKCFIPNERSLICFIGPAAPTVRRQFHSWKRSIKRQAPWLVTVYGMARSLLGASLAPPRA